VLSHPSLGLRPIGTMASSDFSSDILQDFTLRLIPSVTMVLCHRLDETSPVPSSTFATSRTPYTGEFLTAVFRFFAASVAFAMRDRLGSLLLPLWG